MRWPNVGAAVMNLVEGISPAGQFSDLLPGQQEIICAEFLRTTAAADLGLPRLAHQLLPAGRTMRDVDIYGMATDGKRLVGQVTYLTLAQCEDKLARLRKFGDQNATHLILFCRTDAVTQADGVTVVPIETVALRFRETEYGEQWFNFANHTATVPATSPKTGSGN